MFDSGASAPPPQEPGAPAPGLLERWRQELRDEPDPWEGGAESHPDAPPELVGLLSLAQLAGSLDWESLDWDTATAAVRELESVRRVLAAGLAGGMNRLDRGGECVDRTGLRASTWLGSETTCSPASTRRSRRIGSALARFGRFRQAIARGELSDDHAEVLDAVSNPRNADRLEQAEDTLLRLALRSSFDEFRRGARLIANRLDEDGAEPTCSERDSLAMTRASDGTLHLRGTFTGDNATTLEHTIREATERQFRRAARDESEGGPTIPASPALRANALADLVRHGLAHDPHGGAQPRTEAVVVLRSDDEGGSHATCEDGEPLDPATAALLTCDARIRPMVLDARGEIVWVGRASRFATTAQRRALAVRDGGCCFPGCEAPPAWCDAHHIVPWDEGGTTDPDNLALLCRHHHRQLHHGRWELRVVEGQRRWSRPDRT